MFLFLDDIRESPLIVHNESRGLGVEFGKSEKWIIARDYFQFVQILKEKFDSIDFISFDHDISSFDSNNLEITGKDAAKFLTDYCMDNNKKLPYWFVHSDNNNGNKNIRQWLINYMFRVENRIDKMVDAYGFVNNKLIFNF